jgi:hypothetical protein
MTDIHNVPAATHLSGGNTKDLNLFKIKIGFRGPGFESRHGQGIFFVLFNVRSIFGSHTLLLKRYLSSFSGS